MNIWLIQTGELLPIEDNVRKMRTAVLADTLVERGHNVLWWASAFDHFKREWIFKKGHKKETNNKGIWYKKIYHCPDIL